MDRLIALFLLLLALPAPAALGASEDAPEVRKRHRSGPKYQSYLQALPIGRFVDTLSLEALSDLVVTDTKVPQTQDTVTQRIEVLHLEDLALLSTPKGNLAEFLRFTAGQFVNVLSRNDANWGSYAGLGPKYNSYLADGLPVDAFVDAMSLDPWAFERVEIHKGPASALYANYLNMDFAGNEMPLAGITNFILKEEIETDTSRLQLGAGSYATRAGKLYHQGRKGPLHYFFGASHEQSDYTNYGTADSWLRIQQDPAYRKSRFYTKVTWHPEDRGPKLSLFIHHTQHSGDAGRPNRDYAHQYDTLNAAYTHPIRDTANVQLRIGYRGYARSWGEDGYPVTLALRSRERVEQRIIPLDASVSLQHAGGGLLTVGLDAQWANFRTSTGPEGVPMPLNDVTARSTGVFVQEKFILGHVVLRAGLRHDATRHQYERFNAARPARADNRWSSLLWSAGLRYNAEGGWAIFANAASGFLAPSAMQLGGTLRPEDTGVPGRNGRLPNYDLRPEDAVGMDLGLELRLPAAISLGFRAFHNQVKDPIVERIVAREPSQTVSINAGRSRARGFELTLEQSLNDRFQWFANHTHTGTRVENPLDPTQDGADIPFSPDQVSSLGLTAELPWSLLVSPCLRLVGRYYDDPSRASRKRFGPYPELDLRLQKPLARTSDYTLNLTLDLNNLLDRRYEMPWQFRETGFNALVSLQFTF